MSGVRMPLFKEFGTTTSDRDMMTNFVMDCVTVFMHYLRKSGGPWIEDTKHW